MLKLPKLNRMVVTLIRTLIIFLTLIVVMRLMGKRQIGEMQPFEFIVTLIIADLACIPMADTNIPLVYGVVAILGLFILHQILSVIEQRGDVMKFIISGKPSVVINKNGVDLKELKKNNMDISDLLDSMRSLGYFSLDDLDYAIFESNGKLSALENGDKTPTPTSISLLMVNDGKPVKKNLTVSGVSQTEIETLLKENSSSVKKVEVMTLDGNGRIYLKSKGQKYKILNYAMPEGIKW